MTGTRRVSGWVYDESPSLLRRRLGRQDERGRALKVLTELDLYRRIVPALAVSLALPIDVRLQLLHEAFPGRQFHHPLEVRQGHQPPGFPPALVDRLAKRIDGRLGISPHDMHGDINPRGSVMQPIGLLHEVQYLVEDGGGFYLSFRYLQDIGGRHLEYVSPPEFAEE